VLAVPHEKLGEDVFAFVVLREQIDVDPTVLVDIARETGALQSTAPHRVHLRTAAKSYGKVDKVRLRQLPRTSSATLLHKVATGF